MPSVVRCLAPFWLSLMVGYAPHWPHHIVIILSFSTMNGRLPVVSTTTATLRGREEKHPARFGHHRHVSRVNAVCNITGRRYRWGKANGGTTEVTPSSSKVFCKHPLPSRHVFHHEISSMTSKLSWDGSELASCKSSSEKDTRRTVEAASKSIGNVIQFFLFFFNTSENSNINKMLTINR